MPDPGRLLILGGTAEAAELARRAAVDFAGRLDVIYSLAGRIEPERPITGARVRVGGFGGGKGLADYIREERITLLIDATHPFAAAISANAYDAALATDTPRLLLARPPWVLPPGAKYLEAEDMADAVRQLARLAGTVLVTTGQGGLDVLADHPDMHFIVRVIEAPVGAAADNLTFITARPPHRLEEEVTLMQEYAVDALLTKQSGGAATEGKIAAALRLGIPIVCLKRPLPEPGESVGDVDAALRWLASKI